ncbi:hypothetical protein FNF27_04511 [Cafeteria roenbergensis]|uniref:5'-Nucleotidase C-terminal domain-containing protein n=2 Tax=Cafeteria roenbergensis TaxID=33653 RepID=A0A5A8EDC3_CAFRO|nr:hypothetical protein FNF27_04511 [Cafeteria roenbergensis]
MASADHALVNIVHFNDVYHIGERKKEPVGGVARFATLIKSVLAETEAEGLPKPLILFSGDALSPSALSLVTRGAHMVKALNRLGVVASVLGNHDLDDGIANFELRASESDFPWLATNVDYVPKEDLDAEGADAAAAVGAGGEKAEDPTDLALPQGMVRSLTASHGHAEDESCTACDDTTMPGCRRFAVLTYGTVRVGLIGLIEDSWLETLSHVDPEDLVYEDFITSARWWSAKLRSEHACDVVVALTHMRLPNDLRLGSAAASLGVDLVLGGHDHFYSSQEVAAGLYPPGAAVPGEPSKAREGSGPSSEGGALVVKSGTDFQSLTKISLTVQCAPVPDAGGLPESGLPVAAAPAPVAVPRPVKAFHWVRRDATSAVEPDPEALELVERLSEAMVDAGKQVLGHVDVDLDGRFDSVRTDESNLGNLVADLMRRTARSDCAIINGGNFRSDMIHSAGPFSMADLLKILPYPAEVPTVRVSGVALLEALENGVSKWPEREGRFPQVSGIRFQFNGSKEPGSRVVEGSVWVGVGDAARPLDPTRRYSLATTDYASLGNDGFVSISPTTDRGKELGSEWLVDLTRAPVLPSILRSHLEIVDAINKEQARFSDRAIERWRVKLLRLAGKHSVGSVCSGAHHHHSRVSSGQHIRMPRLAHGAAAKPAGTAKPAEAAKPGGTAKPAGAVAGAGGAAAARGGKPAAAAASRGSASPATSPATPAAGSTGPYPAGDARNDPDLCLVQEPRPPALSRMSSAPLESTGTRLIDFAQPTALPAPGSPKPLVFIAPQVEGRVVRVRK